MIIRSGAWSVAAAVSLLLVAFGPVGGQEEQDAGWESSGNGDEEEEEEEYEYDEEDYSGDDEYGDEEGEGEAGAFKSPYTSLNSISLRCGKKGQDLNLILVYHAGYFLGKISLVSRRFKTKVKTACKRGFDFTHQGYDDYDEDYDGDGDAGEYEDETDRGDNEYYDEAESEDDDDGDFPAAFYASESFAPEMISVPLSITVHVGDRMELPCSAKARRQNKSSSI